ncbi:hypothetical protein CCACVL1_26327 [Corchorus capsularis]|uniref:Uncharacterized protein n=1 Tax=Corchorus capsularis TaxID=210143 RepID=A0A1R3GF77_COCAP|nr:hypothetical protein CCACVL1_26327 [Corchorus capsularis]
MTPTQFKSSNRLKVEQIKLRKEREESLEIDAESNPVHKFPVPMKEGEILDDFCCARKYRKNKSKSPSLF